MIKLEFLIDNPNYANINDCEYAEAEIRIGKKGDYELLPKLGGKIYYKNALEVIKSNNPNQRRSKKIGTLFQKIRVNLEDSYLGGDMNEHEYNPKVLVESFEGNYIDSYTIKFRIANRKDELYKKDK